MRLPSLLRCLALIAVSPVVLAQPQSRDLSLDGPWQTGLDRNYTATTPVPGLAQDTSKPSPGTLWYRRTVTLPQGDWKLATLTLKGARFHPEVYIEGEHVASSEGGMAPIAVSLPSKAIAPGRTVTLEIALRSLNDMPATDASTVPGADLWRSDVSSGLWDDVTLHLSGDERIASAIPWADLPHRKLAVHWKTEGDTSASTIRTEVVGPTGIVFAHSESPAAPAGIATLTLPAAIKTWSPDHPNLYRLRLTLLRNGHVEDTTESTWGLKQFETHDRRFYLNGEPVELLGGTVVWHRFLRQPGAAEVAFSTDWFEKNIAARLKSYGANTLRWHLGLPPERLLDMCDRDGLMVQLEWPFFHGISASVPSMEMQWTSWLDVAMRHPSVVIVHPWNETGDPAAIRNGWAALNAILPNYPPLVVAHRDTVHIHKYWWSLFENLGLYYDSAAQFDQTAMVDEFGGNYLDWNGDPGGYPSTRESFLRFLGRDQTRADRLEFHAESNARIAEYWRRIGAAGILPFCILGGPQDGSSWFLGSIQDPQPMPVWDALAATWSPISVSLDVWDRNYTPGQRVTLPLYLFNDSSSASTLSVDVGIVDPTSSATLSHLRISQSVAAHTRKQIPVTLQLPNKAGAFRFQALLLNPPPTVHHRVASWWDIRTLAPKLPDALADKRIAIAADEPELTALFQQNGIAPLTANDPTAQVIVGSSATWNALANSTALRSSFGEAIRRGVSFVLLDVGPRDLGEGYRKQSLGSLEGAPVLHDAYTVNADLFEGVRIAFHQQAEPESHIQPAAEDRSLWQGLPIQATWIWNGLRGGLIAPAADMEVFGLSQQALLAQWKQHGADAAQLASGGSYYAYELAGFYAFSGKPDDKPTQDTLRAHVKLLAEDAPALKDSIDPNAAIHQIDLAAAYRDAADAHAERLVPLSTCGKNLTRAEIVELSFGPGQGNLILSQALTAGRLARGASEDGFYGMRYDPAAEQFTLNMIAQAIKPLATP